MKIYVVGGEPATGKTYLTRALVGQVQDFHLAKFGLLRLMHSPEHKFYLLGIYDFAKRHPFDGTDRLSMAVIKDAKTFLRWLAAHDPEGVVFCEGDRLFCREYLRACEAAAGPENLHIYVLVCSEETRKTRHGERKDGQNQAWLRGRHTKIQHILETYPAAVQLRNDDAADFQTNLGLLRSNIFENNS